MTNERIELQLRTLPAAPGVYLMKDAAGGVIYVGKSKNLQQRVRSYFHVSRHRSKKVERLAHNVKDLEIRRTDTEFEALMLECRLIQELKPIYNKKMKSPLGYVYLAIRDTDGIWKLLMCRTPREPAKFMDRIQRVAMLLRRLSKAFAKLCVSLAAVHDQRRLDFPV
jgi:excinuclease ABC subunit C